jgi:MFS family permease
VERRWKVLIVTSVAVFVGFLDVTVVNVAFPDIERSFRGDSVAGLSWILNAYNIVFAALLVPAGRIADLVGRRRLFFVGLGAFLGASAVCAAAPSVPVLVAARVVQAAGAADSAKAAAETTTSTPYRALAWCTR